MCGGGSFSQYVVSFWIAELLDKQKFNANAEKIFNQLSSYAAVREVYFDPAEGKMTLLCIYGQLDSEIFKKDISRLGYTIMR